MELPKTKELFKAKTKRKGARPSLKASPNHLNFGQEGLSPKGLKQLEVHNNWWNL